MMKFVCTRLRLQPYGVLIHPAAYIQFLTPGPPGSVAVQYVQCLNLAFGRIENYNGEFFTKHRTIVEYNQESSNSEIAMPLFYHVYLSEV